jgi:hypothetical protein
LPSGGDSPTVSASAPATATWTGRSPSPTPGSRGASVRGSASCAPSTYEPAGTVAPGALDADGLAGWQLRRRDDDRPQRTVPALYPRAIPPGHSRRERRADQGGGQEDQRTSPAAHAANA